MPFSSRFWFRWQRFKESVREFLAGREKSADSAHRMCPECRGLIGRDESVCPLCGTKLRAPRSRAVAQGRVLGGLLPVPSTATSAVVAVCLFLYAVCWYLTYEQAAAELRPSPSWGGIGGEVLFRFGSKVAPLILSGEWWRLVTAIFLHAGLLHIGFNLWVLMDIGPAVESTFSTPKFLVMFLASGVVGFLASMLWNPYGQSVGASGAVLGLIGVLIGASFHHGTLGREYRSHLLRWVIYIFVFGFVIRGIDNAAHFGGLVTGALLGYLISEGEPETRGGENFWNALALVVVIAIAGSFALMALQFNRPL
jgi:rhomboid protease GluP